MGTTSPLRHAVVGAGAGIFGAHLRGLQLETAELVAVSDIDAENGARRAAELGCAFFHDHNTMLAQTQPDIVVILTPHPFHASIAIDCLDHGCHVLVEKPMAVQVTEADAMIAAAARAQRLLAVNFQQRFRPEVRAAKRLIQRGELGEIQHVQMVETWTRTATYYRRAGWRGTWNGEGGGVLLNQAPHNLDLICHLAGMPSRVAAWMRTQMHQIETEDTAHAMLEWPNGAWGTLHVSTAEAGQPQRTEIVGTNGYMSITPNGLTFRRFESNLVDFVMNSPEPFASPGLSEVEVEMPTGVGDHLWIYRNLHAAILNGEDLIADGSEGRMSLELANAITYSSSVRSDVRLPLDRAKYATLLADYQAGRRSIGKMGAE